MSNGTASFASALFAGLLAAFTLATISSDATRAADDCLSGPNKDQTPAGGHWYYRIDHATKRHCWYLGEERGKLSQVAPSNSPPSAKPASPNNEPAMQPAVANAHAELPPQAAVEAPNRVNAPAAAQPVITEDNRDAAGATPRDSIFASRWLDQSSAAPPAGLAPDKPEAGATVNAAPDPEPPVLAAGQLAAADASSQTSAYSVPVRLAAALMGALALAGILASIIFRFGSKRRPAPARIRRRRGVDWESTDDDSIQLAAHPQADGLPRRPGFTRDFDRPGNRDERVAEFFSQLSRRTPG